MGSAFVERLSIESLRNIERVDLQIGSPAALFFGGNGAGKTSVLEAVYLVVRGKSFRGRKSGDLTLRGKELVRVVGDFRRGEDWSDARLSYVRRRTESEHQINGVAMREGGSGAIGVFVRLIGEGAYKLAEDQPAIRRNFLDLNLFHVEHQGAKLLAAFKRTLDQRNAWLRAGSPGRPVWDSVFISRALELESARKALFCEVECEFAPLASSFGFLDGSALVLQQGWRDNMTLDESLAVDRCGETRAGFTRVGPQRADFWVTNSVGRLQMSRGQRKIFACLLQLAFDRVQRRRQRQSSVWLIDDIWADLDGASSRRICSLLSDASGQCLFTKLEQGKGVDLDFLPSATRMFHVERGAVIAIS